MPPRLSAGILSRLQSSIYGTSRLTKRNGVVCCLPEFHVLRQLASNPYQRSLVTHMRNNPFASQSSPSPRKRRKLSQEFILGNWRKLMSMEAGTVPATTPQVHLTPIEETLRLLLLDAVDYVKQKQRQGDYGTDTPGDGLVLRFTGGWVRDKLLGIDSHDIDVGISTMTGYQFGLALKEYLDVPANLEKYKQYHLSDPSKTSMVSLHKIEKNPEKSKHLETVTTKIFGLDVDLVNLRKETYSDDSRNPQMEFGTVQEDAMRRDATVNALFYNLNTASVEDLTGMGLNDMESCLVRTPMEPYQTFKDDPLRVLRLIRFASRLRYDIVATTEEAMQNEDIKQALKAKISQERIGVEVEKMLQGPDPLKALQIIHRLNLYDTIFANHQDNVGVDTTSWHQAYGALVNIIDTTNEGPALASRESLRRILIRNSSEQYYSWMLAAMAPWAPVSPCMPHKNQSKPIPARAASVSRDSLRADNKTMNIINSACKNFQKVSDFKTLFLGSAITGSPEEVRENAGQFIRELGQEWRLCVVLTILVEIMQGANSEEVFRSYEKFLLYIEQEDLTEVPTLRPLVNGRDISVALGVKTGPWMNKAIELIIGWQLRNPGNTDRDSALQIVLSKREELGLKE